ncbi:putative neural-cadherin 2 [Homarus americanus]|uniref:putative neural-cadherin 2 n=1 Tax=Homarus americanus TaxID=6706 RepID=UPI001C470878|nr:putative neural-cadherin 2 [Homarus americanus]
MDPGKIFQIITNSTLLATRLLSGSGSGPLEFSEPRYCAVLSEDAQLAATVLAVTATHKQGTSVRYTITGGNKDGLFTIDQHSGVITLAAALDYEAHHKHELVVAAEVEGQAAHAMVQVTVLDVNDNAPYFLNPKPQVTVVEEDDRHLPATIATVEATDPDWLDHHGLLYTVRGDGVDGFHPTDAFFSVNSLTGELIQLRALDRDPPRGKEVWKVRVQVRDGQALWSRQAMDRLLASNSKKKNKDHNDKVNRRRRNTNDKSNKRRIKRGNISQEPLITQGHDKGDIAAGVEKFIEEIPDMREGSHLPEHREKYTRIDGDELSRNSNVNDDINLENGGKYPRRYSLHTVLDSRKNYEPRERKTTMCGRQQEVVPENFKGERMRMNHDSGGSKIHDDSQTRYRGDSGAAVTSHYGDGDGDGDGDLMPSSKTTHDDLDLRTTPEPSLKLKTNEQSPRSLFLHLESNSSNHAHKSRSYDDKLLSSDSRSTTEKTIPLVSKNGIKATHIAESLADKSDSVNNIQTSAYPPNGTEPTINPGSGSKTTHPENLSRNSGRSRDSGIRWKTLPESIGPQPSLVTPRGRRAAGEEDHYHLGSFSTDSGCDEGQDSASGNKTQAAGRRLGGGSLNGLGGSRVHVAETVVTVLVKDINDNPPVFPNATMYGEVQENGPIDLSVVVIAAWDADDVSEGTNARITYTIQKNVVYEPTGEAIFSVQPETGLVRTSICCLDRETTPEYEVQVVATDGGGLQGTGVVVVRLVDVNDNSPRLEQSQWDVEIDETWGPGPPDDSTLLQITALDADTSNYFFYRVVEASGWGWEHFGIRSVGAEGQLFALQTLDYEDDTHRRGFKFMVQVTDRGRGGWRDARHMDAAWVSIRLRDVNDNPPKFHRPHAHVTVKEDAAPGTLLAALPAHDPDMGGVGEVLYRVEGGWGALTVDSEGGVSLRRALDREAPDGAIGVAKVVGVDRGRPPLSATATLTITVTDVNDSPPVLLPPTVFHVTEDAAPTLLGSLTATDHDVWALGHGPPFNLSLAPTNPAHVLAHINLKFDPHLDSGRGGAEVWTVGAVDREEHRQLLVGVLVADAGGMAATHTVTIIVDDINDNPMKPAAKTVYLWKTQGGGSEAPLGRVYVEDPDDWDLADKTFRWQGSPHPLFSLNTRTGDIFASSQVRAGRYELQFTVSDHLWGQRDVAANVTVTVKVLTPDALAHASPVTLTPTTPAHLTRGWTPEHGGGGLGRVIQGVLRVVGETAHTVEVVSVYTHPDPAHLDHPRPQHPPYIPASTTPTRQHPQVPRDTPEGWLSDPQHAPSACVWVSVRETPAGFMDPVKLQGLLALHAQQLEEATNLTVVVEAPTSGSNGGVRGPPHPSLHHGGPPDPSSAASRASTTLPLQVVDTNTTSLVTPLLTRASDCHAHEPETCTPISCLNGGRCLPSSSGNR